MLLRLSGMPGTSQAILQRQVALDLCSACLKPPFAELLGTSSRQFAGRSRL
jgi:hypothetical protein